MWWHSLPLCCYFALSLLLSPAHAIHSTLYGLTQTKELIEIDRDTGALVETVGSYVLEEEDDSPSLYFDSCAVDRSGRLVTTVTYPDYQGIAVYEMDPETVAVTKVLDVVGLITPSAVRSIAMDSEDTLYMAGRAFVLGRFSNWIWTIDWVTGLATSVGNLFDLNCDGLAFDRDNVLYCLDVANGFFRVDTTTGATTLLAEHRFIGTSLEFDPVTGKMLAARESLYEIDLFDYSITEVGPIEPGIRSSVRGLFVYCPNPIRPQCICDILPFARVRHWCEDIFCADSVCL